MKKENNRCHRVMVEIKRNYGSERPWEMQGSVNLVYALECPSLLSASWQECSVPSQMRTVQTSQDML